MIGIIDYGVGNLGSLERAFEEIGIHAELIESSESALKCTALVLPGVGALTECMDIVRANGWELAIRKSVETGIPLLGICLGMQLLADFGTEGADSGTQTACLGLVPGKVVHLRSVGCKERVPHVGWNEVYPTGAPESKRFLDLIPTKTDFYFVHSYTFVPSKVSTVLALAKYGPPVVAAVGKNRVWGTQFHPEKSGRAGLQILRNFAKMTVSTC